MTRLKSALLAGLGVATLCLTAPLAANAQDAHARVSAGPPAAARIARPARVPDIAPRVRPNATRPDVTRPDATRPGATRPDVSRERLIAACRSGTAPAATCRRIYNAVNDDDPSNLRQRISAACRSGEAPPSLCRRIYGDNDQSNEHLRRRLWNACFGGGEPPAPLCRRVFGDDPAEIARIGQALALETN